MLNTPTITHPVNNPPLSTLHPQSSTPLPPITKQIPILHQPKPENHDLSGHKSLRSDAVSANLILVTNDQVYDVPWRTQTPYQLNQLFAVATLKTGCNPREQHDDIQTGHVF